MKRATYALIFALVVAGSLATAFIVSVVRGGARSDVTDVANLSFRPHPGRRLPVDKTLVDEAGRTIRLGTYFTKSPVILVLEYLHCTSLCGVTLDNLVGDTLNRLPFQPGRDYQLVAISIDPRDQPRDAAAAAAKYAALLDRPAGRAGLHFLTGSPAAVRDIADTIGFPYHYEPLLDAYIHPAGFVVAAPDGVISRYIEGAAASPRELIAAFADAQQDKSQGPLTRLLVLCHIQGTPLGRWTVPVVATFTVANIAAALTVLAIFVAIRRGRYG